jgi:hypothetical protein
LLDIHGEYAPALSEVAAVFRVAPLQGERRLVVPFWALPPSDLLDFLMGKLDDRASTAVIDKIFAAKYTRVAASPVAGVDPASMTVDSPLPYSLRQLWFDLLDPEVRTWSDASRSVRAIVEEGDAATLRPPRYQPATTTNTAPFLNNVNVLGIRRQLDKMRSRLLDRRFDFLLNPAEWAPDTAGIVEQDLPELLHGWLGHDRPITVLDLSGIPSMVLVQLIGSILAIIYEGLFWGRELPEGGRQRPQLVVMEEAHRYLGKETDNPARNMVQRIVKEGRKFGIGAMIVSQRPSEIDDTILSQCGTFIAMRLSNVADRGRLQAALPDNLSGIADSLPVLRTGEAIITGEAAKLPVRCRISLPPSGSRPNSEDPEIATNWRKPREEEQYDTLVAAWRAQDSSWGDSEDDDG